MPTISEDGANDRGIQEFQDNVDIHDPKLEQLMVSMLEQRDRLTENLQKQQRYGEQLEEQLRTAEREKDSLKRQIEVQTQHMHGVRLLLIFLYLEKFYNNILTITTT